MQQGRWWAALIGAAALLIHSTGLANPRHIHQHTHHHTHRHKPHKIVAHFSRSVRHFMKMMEIRYHFSHRQLVNIFSQVRFIPAIIEKIKHPYEKKPWPSYKIHFLNQQRIIKGAQYWQAHETLLKKISHQYHVDPSVIVAIIGVETNYGHVQGKYSELNTLATLAFHYHRRSKFFRNELAEFLLLSRQQHFSPFYLKGSYAGALGIPQFMPSNFRKFAIDYSHKHHIDLLHNHADAMASIANYLHRCGWQFNRPIAYPAKLINRKTVAFVSDRGLIKMRLKSFLRRGQVPTYSLTNSLQTSLIALQSRHHWVLWLIFPNFHAIMQYNPQMSYAMAVYQLSRNIRAIYEKKTTRNRLSIASTRTLSRSEGTL